MDKNRIIYNSIYNFMEDIPTNKKMADLLKMRIGDTLSHRKEEKMIKVRSRREEKEEKYKEEESKENQDEVDRNRTSSGNNPCIQ